MNKIISPIIGRLNEAKKEKEEEKKDKKEKKDDGKKNKFFEKFKK